MVKNAKEEIISILDELILYCDGTNRNSMSNEYRLIKNDLFKDMSYDKAKDICIYLRRYSNQTDPLAYEDIRIERIINFFQNWKANDMNQDVDRAAGGAKWD